MPSVMTESPRRSAREQERVAHDGRELADGCRETIMPSASSESLLRSPSRKSVPSAAITSSLKSAMTKRMRRVPLESALLMET